MLKRFAEENTRKALRELESTETSRLKRLMALLVEYGYLLLQDHFSSDPVKSYLLMFFFQIWLILPVDMDIPGESSFLTGFHLSTLV